MSSEQRLDLHVTCDYCGHENHLTVATASLSDQHPVNCAVCGGKVGTLADLKARDPATLRIAAE